MTDIKEAQNNKAPAKAKKLALNKETIKDLAAAQGVADAVRGGRAARACTEGGTGC